MLYQIINSNLSIKLNKNQKNTPIVIGHGLQDEVVIPEKSIEAYEILKKQNAKVDIIETDEEIKMIDSQIQQEQPAEGEGEEE